MRVSIALQIIKSDFPSIVEFNQSHLNESRINGDDFCSFRNPFIELHSTLIPKMQRYCLYKNLYINDTLCAANVEVHDRNFSISKWRGDFLTFIE